jgi:hypothetical protein
MVEVTLMEPKEGGYQLLHLVNGSGHFGVSYFAPVRLSGLEIAVPYAGTPSSVACLVSGKQCEFEAGGDTLTLRLPSLDLFEAIKISA